MRGFNVKNTKMEQQYIRLTVTLATINNYYNKNNHAAAHNVEKNRVYIYKDEASMIVTFWNFYNFEKEKMVPTVTCKPKNSFKTI